MRWAMTTNGEVEGPPRSADQAPRAHTVFQRPRRVTTNASRTPPTIVRQRLHSIVLAVRSIGDRYRHQGFSESVPRTVMTFPTRDLKEFHVRPVPGANSTVTTFGHPTTLWLRVSSELLHMGVFNVSTNTRCQTSPQFPWGHLSAGRCRLLLRVSHAA
jgi:hypothetical protein